MCYVTNLKAQFTTKTTVILLPCQEATSTDFACTGVAWPSGCSVSDAPRSYAGRVLESQPQHGAGTKSFMFVSSVLTTASACGKPLSIGQAGRYFLVLAVGKFFLFFFF